MPFMIATGDPLAWLGAVPAGVLDGLVIDPGALASRSTAAAESQGSERRHALPSELALRQGPLAFQAYRALRPGRRALWVCRAGEWAAIAALTARLRFDVGCPILWERRGHRHHVVLVLTKSPTEAAGPWPEVDSVASTEDDGVLPKAIARTMVDAISLAGEWIWDPFGAVPTLGTTAIGAGRGYACNVRDGRRARVLTAAFEATGAVRAIVPPYGMGGARGLGQLTIFEEGCRAGDAIGGLGDGLSDGTRFRESAAAGDGLR